MFTIELRLFGLFLDVLGAIILALNGTPFLDRKVDRFTDSRPFVKAKEKLFNSGSISETDRGFRTLLNAHGKIFPAEGRDSPYPPYPERVVLKPSELDNAHFVTESGSMDLEDEEVAELVFQFSYIEDSWFDSREEFETEGDQVSLGEPSTGPLLYGYEELWKKRRAKYEDYAVYLATLFIVVGFALISITFLS